MQYKAQEEAFSAFSLVELMISLITVSLVSAAFAPVITKKLSRSMVTVKSAVAAIRSDCAKFDENGGKCNACIDESCLLCDIHCGEYQYKNIGKCLCENCSERSEGCLECSSQGCDKCADGYYIDESLKCVKCPKGSKCPNGKKRELCPIGYYQDEEKKTTCKPCLTKNGNYTNEEGSTACLSCVAGQYTTDNDNNWSASENINGTQCLTCPLGWKCPDGKNPIACASGAYQDEAGKTTCKGCPTGTYSPNSPSSSCSSCDGKCTACYQSATNCSSCTSGNYLSGSSCNSCPVNASCSGGTNSFNCNTYFTKSGSNCVRTSCPSGQYISGTTCYGCPANASCNGSSSYTCNSGYTLQNGSCVVAKPDGTEIVYVNGVKYWFTKYNQTYSYDCEKATTTTCTNKGYYSGCGRWVCSREVSAQTCSNLNIAGYGGWKLPSESQYAAIISNVNYTHYDYLSLCTRFSTANNTRCWNFEDKFGKSYPGDYWADSGNGIVYKGNTSYHVETYYGGNKRSVRCIRQAQY